MAGLLYEPEEGKYNLPIFDNDDLFISQSLRLFIDTYVANYGHEINHATLWNHFWEQANMIRDNARETLELCEKEIIEEVKKC